MSSQQSTEPNKPETTPDEEVVAHLDMILDPDDADPERKRKRKEYEPAGEDELGRKRK